MIIATLVMNMVTMMVLALVSSMQPLTTTNESGSEFILPLKRQGVASSEARLRWTMSLSVLGWRGIRSVVLFGSLISSRREFNHLTAMLIGVVAMVTSS